MKPEHSPDSEHNDAVLRLRERRLFQIFWAVQLALLAGGLAHAWWGTGGVTQTLVVCSLLLVPGYILARRGHFERGALVILSAIVLGMTWLMWGFSGLHDEALLAFPVILMVSAVLGSKRLMLAFLAFMLLVLVTMGYAVENGLREFQLPSQGMETAVTLGIILCATAYAIWLLSKDMRAVMRQLADENVRVLESQEKIQRLVHHDALTSLPNRVLARDRFEQAVLACQRDRSQVCLMFLDLDNFKDINDSYGHQYGDEFLVEIAGRLQNAVRKSDTICRQGGDEFLLIFPAVRSEDQIAAIALGILESVNQPIELGESRVSATVSIGIAVTPDDGEDFDTICRNADVAMYHAKQSGRNTYHFYDPEMHDDAQEKVLLVGDMHTALAEEQFLLHYQPQIDLVTGRVVGAEALLRWEHPTRGFISPRNLIPLAERSGLIVEIGAWVARTATRECMRWHKAGYEELSVAINLSSLQFRRGNITSIIREALDDSGLPPESLELELTESMLIDDTPMLTSTLEELGEMGVRFAIDDFGTGYSNLGYLKRFDVGSIKIDRSFVHRILTDSQDRAIVEAIVQMANSLNLAVVAEGVETAAVSRALRILQCRYGQGYLWARPLDGNGFFDFLRQRSELRLVYKA